MIVKKTATYRKWEQRLKDKKARAIIESRLFRLADGLAGDVKSVGDKVHELRIHFGPGYRIYFTYRGEELILLLCGGDKRSQQKDIAAAKRMIKEGFEHG